MITIAGKNYNSREEYDEEYDRVEDAWAAERQIREHKRWSASDAGKLCKQLFDAYHAYRQHLKSNPRALLPAGRAPLESFGEHQVYLALQERLERDRQNLEKAKVAARCTHVKPNGVQCGSPRIRGQRLCYAHKRIRTTRPVKLPIPALEDPNGIQMALMGVVKALVDGTMEQKQAGLLLYALQIASCNVRLVDFEPFKEALEQTPQPITDDVEETGDDQDNDDQDNDDQDNDDAQDNESKE